MLFLIGKERVLGCFWELCFVFFSLWVGRRYLGVFFLVLVLELVWWGWKIFVVFLVSVEWDCFDEGWECVC